MAILIAASILNVLAFSPDGANAQSVTIQTSADDHDGTFFGGLLQVVIEDENTNDEDDTIEVDITAEADGGNVASDTFIIDDTNDGSQRFEFFIAHTNSDDISPDDPENNLAPSVITFGAGAADLDVVDFDLYDSGSIEIQYGDESVTINYDESSAELNVDRETPYGSTSIVHLFVTDQDGNLDPTDTDSFIVLQADLDLLIGTTGASFVDDVMFEETGDNTGLFEAVLQLTTVDTALDPELSFSSESVTMVLNDMATYNDVGFDNPENDSTDTSELTIEIDDTDGSMDALADLTFASEIIITIRDDDQNLDSEQQDSIPDALFVEVDSLAGDSEFLDLEETDENTGVFQIELVNSELRTTFLADGDTPTDNNGVLELRAEDISHDITMGYIDPLSDNSVQEVVAEIVVALSIVNGTLDLPDTASIDETFAMILVDNDLNDNRRIRDSYTIILDGLGPYPLTRGGSVYGESAQFDIRFEGSSLNFGAPIPFTFTETAINSGVFIAELDLSEILASAGVEGEDGDELEITYKDLMGDVSSESSNTLVIGTPIPPTPTDMLEELIGVAEANDIDTSTLKQAGRLLGDDNPNNNRAVCGVLEAFIHQLQNQAGKKIDPDVAEDLQGLAADIQEQIRC
jgi:hypothetical protein